MQIKNKPYVKNIEVRNGIEYVTNPITKEEPYIHLFTSVKDEKRQLKKPINNKKGIRLVVTNLGKGLVMKTKITKQSLQPVRSKIRMRSSKIRRVFETIEHQNLSFTK